MTNHVMVNLLADPFANRAEIDSALDEAVYGALLEHKKAGNPVATWQDGKVVWVAPEDIVLPSEYKVDSKQK